MINLLIWSKNRACQLHLLLESLEKNMEGVFKTTVINTSSSEEFADGYAKCLVAFPDVEFIYEDNFCSQTKKWLYKAGDHVCFSTDDTVIYRKPQYHWQRLDLSDTATFSLRVGRNALMQNCHTGEYQPQLTAFDLDFGFHPFSDTQTQDEITLRWNFNHYHPNHNYGYPFGLDMHIYRADVMKKLLKYHKFNNTNELESYLFNCKHLVPQYMSCLEQSCAVNIPANNMSGVTIAGQEHGSTIEELNSAYLGGQTIDLSKIEATEIIGCHQEIPLELK